MPTQKIRVSAGAVLYTLPWTATETTGKDISAATIQLSLGSYTDPGDWLDPDVETRPTLSSVTAKILIDDSYEAGTYWLWRSISDTPEVDPQKTSLRVIVS